jgi:tetratricopeptide (TPR) repeat protein
LSPDEAMTRRFVREMQVTALLQHPSIITLHEAGRFGSGEPFFTMKLVEGRTLKEELDSRPSGRERLALLPRLLAATDAIAYAHERGIVHRDIKPGNILLGRFGETVVIDWGLAATRGAADTTLPPHESGERPMQEPLTVAGGVLGTPAYMAPEQARGEAVDRRADVYSLGAVLYHLLAGAPPYRGATAREIMAQAFAGAPQPLSPDCRALAPELVAIIDKSMAREPGERYASAREMAEDLERFTTGRLVSAHSYTPAALLRRWFAQHRAAVSVGLVLCLALALTTSLGVARIVRERNRAESSSQVATQHREAAEQLVDYLIVELRTRLDRLDRLDVLLGVGAEVAGYYERTQGSTSDPPALERRAGALEALGLVEQDKHQSEPALALYQRAVDLRRRAAEGGPPSAASLVEWSRALNNMAVIEVDRGRIEPALGQFREAIAIAERAVAIDPRLLPPHLRAIRSVERIAELYELRKGDVAGALTHALDARERLVRLLDAHPDDAEILARLAAVSGQIGRLERSLGRLAQARASAVASTELYARALRQQPGNGVWARGHAVSFLGLSNAEHARRRLPEALAAMHEHLSRYQAIAEADPENEATARELAWSQLDACELDRHAGRIAEATAACSSALSTIERQLQKDPTSSGAQDALVSALVAFAPLHVLEGRPDRAREALARALDVARALLKEDPELQRWQKNLASVLRHRACSGAVDRAPTAEDEGREGVAWVARLRAAAPDDVQLLELAVDLQRCLAGLSPASPMPAAALARGRAVLDELQALVQRQPEWIPFQTALAAVRLELSAMPEAMPSGESERARRAALQTLAELRARGQLYAEEERR